MNYENMLLDEGITSTRTPSLRDAFNSLHSAVCALDRKNLKIFFSKSLNTRLSEFSKIEGCSDMESILKEGDKNA